MKGIAAAAAAQWVKRKDGSSNSSRDRPNVKTGSDSSTAKRSAIGVSVTGLRR